MFLTSSNLLTCIFFIIYKLGEIVRYICDVMSNLIYFISELIIRISELNWKSELTEDRKLSELKVSELISRLKCGYTSGMKSGRFTGEDLD